MSHKIVERHFIKNISFSKLIHPLQLSIDRISKIAVIKRLLETDLSKEGLGLL